MSQSVRLRSAVPVLTALDVAAAAAFWTELGFAAELVQDDFAKLRRDDVQIFIAAVRDQVVPDNTQAWVRVSGLAALHAEWARTLSTDWCDASGPAMTPIVDQPWGPDFAVRDAAGNCVHFNELRS